VNKQNCKWALSLVVVLIGSVAAAPAASASPLLLNGDFEAGLANWTVFNQAGANGSWFSDTPGTTLPLSGLTTSAAGGSPHGSLYAVTDQGGPGTHALLQSFTVTPASTVVLTFDMFVNNYATVTVNNGALNFQIVPSQYGRVDILTAGAGALDTGGNVVANLFAGADLGANPHPFTSYVFDLTPFVGAGGTFQLRFADVDNQLFFNMGVDNVSIESSQAAPIPEPSTLLLLTLGLAGKTLVRRRTSQ
jgi:hypothetical protein